MGIGWFDYIRPGSTHRGSCSRRNDSGHRHALTRGRRCDWRGCDDEASPENGMGALSACRRSHALPKQLWKQILPPRVRRLSKLRTHPSLTVVHRRQQCGYLGRMRRSSDRKTSRVLVQIVRYSSSYAAVHNSNLRGKMTTEMA